MIVCALEESGRIESLHPLFGELMTYVKNNDLLNAPTGRITIKGDDLFINNVNPATVAQDKQVLEVHRDYIDVHILLEGKERIAWKNLADCEECVQEYKADGDCALYSDAGTTYVDLLPGQCCIVWPEDAHGPVIGDGDKIRKLIAKVKI